MGNQNKKDIEPGGAKEPGPQTHPLKPLFAARIEERLMRALLVPPELFAGAKLAVIVPLAVICLGREVPLVSDRAWPALLVFSIYVLLDYLGQLAARARGQEREFGRIFDRASDLPIVIILAYLSRESLPYYLPMLKAAADLLLLILYFMRRGSPKNRMRNAVNYAVLLAMLFVWLGLDPKLFNPELLSYLLAANVVFSAVAALYNLRILQKRFIADTLSGANLMCGIFSMVFAAKLRFDISLLFLMLGAAFDGFDGAAARKWGGTRWGVYSDDVADAVNYGVAPGVALHFALPGISGYALGCFYSAFTISRLVFFTLNKDESDPNLFYGVPSTMGGLITLCALILFPDYPALIGMMVGIACIFMVSFDTSYKHLGRALARHKRAFFGMPLLIIILIGGLKLFGVAVPAGIILLASIIYSLKPTFDHMLRLMTKKQ